MLDLQAPLVQRIGEAIGPVRADKVGFGQQMSAISTAAGRHIAMVVRAINAENPDAAINEAAEILRRQVAEVARGQYAFDSLSTEKAQ